MPGVRLSVSGNNQFHCLLWGVCSLYRNLHTKNHWNCGSRALVRHEFNISLRNTPFLPEKIILQNEMHCKRGQNINHIDQKYQAEKSFWGPYCSICLWEQKLQGPADPNLWEMWKARHLFSINPLFPWPVEPQRFTPQQGKDSGMTAQPPKSGKIFVCNFLLSLFCPLCCFALKDLVQFHTFLFIISLLWYS